LPRCRERGAKALQEQVDDEHDQDHRFDQRVDHFLDRQPHEIVSIERDHVVEARGKLRLHLRQRIAHGLRHDQSVRARLLVDRDESGGRAVELGIDHVLLQAELCARDIAESHYRTAVLTPAQNDLFILAGLGERPLRGHRKSELDRARGGLLADLSRAE
jgi:hypothetical protein